MDEIPSVPYEESVRWVLDKFGKLEECAAKGHPYPGIAGPYQPGRPVDVQCTNCNGFYERRPTGKEISAYNYPLNLEVRASQAA